MNEEGGLFIFLTEKDVMHNAIFITLNKEDAVELISELAWEFGLIDDQSMESGHYFWQGSTP
jgi:hypothetical protein